LQVSLAGLKVMVKSTRRLEPQATSNIRPGDGGEQFSRGARPGTSTQRKPLREFTVQSIGIEAISVEAIVGWHHHYQISVTSL
jgi:hypothetical protein